MSKREYPARPLVGVGAVIVRGGRVVLVKRAAEPRRGRWSIPGGLVETGESLRAAAAREAKEETGLAVNVGEVLEVFESITPDARGRTRFHYVLVDFLCRVRRGRLRPGGDAQQAVWAKPSELRKYHVSEAASRIIRKALAGR